MTRPPIQLWERVRVIIFLVLYAGAAEYVSPLPFVNSRMGKLIYLLILVFLGKELVRLRQESSARFYAKTQARAAKWKARTGKLSDYAKHRIQRVIRLAFILYAFGWMVDGLTERCTGAIPCALLAPKMFVENLPAFLQAAIYIAIGLLQIFGMMYVMAKADLYTIILPESIRTRFSDVYGQDRAVARMVENLDMLNNPDEIERKGGYMPGGILLWGPPGTGKTMLAEAFAGETGKPYVFVGPGSFSNMFVGVPILKVKMLFRKLRKLALKHGGVVCFMDEIDSLGNRGGGVTQDDEQTMSCVVDYRGEAAHIDKVSQIMPSSGGMGVLEIFLAEMSGLAKPKGLFNQVKKLLGFQPSPPPKYRILFIGATNLPGRLDPALLRPGRFDRKLHVGYPDLKGRLATFRGYLGKITHDLTDEQIETLARDNPKATGASVKDIVNEALIRSVREKRDVVTWDDIRESVIWKSMGEVEGRQPNEEDQWLTALHEAAHAVAAHHFRKDHRIAFASVERRGQTLGVVSSIETEERFARSRTDYLADIRVCLASKWAEDYFGVLTSGPSSDLAKATEIARRMLNQFSMGKQVAVMNVEAQDLFETQWKALDKFLRGTYEELAEFLRIHRDQVEAVAQLLNVQGTVDGEEVHALIDRLEGKVAA